jgi:hypothetical protein
LADNISTIKIALEYITPVAKAVSNIPGGANATDIKAAIAEAIGQKFDINIPQLKELLVALKSMTGEQ